VPCGSSLHVYLAVLTRTLHLVDTSGVDDKCLDDSLIVCQRALAGFRQR
jgi:hypothetical protein